MKKLLIGVLLCALLLPSQALAAGAPIAPEPEPDATVLAPLWAAWGKNYENAPDVGGIYGDNGKRIYVLLVNGGTESRKQEILGMVGNADWISFESCKYSYAQLKAVQDAIAPEMNGSSVVQLGIDVKRNRVRIGILKAALESVGEVYMQRYGDMVYAEEADYVIPTDGRGVPNTGGEPGFSWLFAITLGCLCMVLRKKTMSRANDRKTY